MGRMGKHERAGWVRDKAGHEGEGCFKFNSCLRLLHKAKRPFLLKFLVLVQCLRWCLRRYLTPLLHAQLFGVADRGIGGGQQQAVVVAGECVFHQMIGRFAQHYSDQIEAIVAGGQRQFRLVAIFCRHRQKIYRIRRETSSFHRLPSQRNASYSRP